MPSAARATAKGPSSDARSIAELREVQGDVEPNYRPRGDFIKRLTSTAGRSQAFAVNKQQRGALRSRAQQMKSVIGSALSNQVRASSQPLCHHMRALLFALWIATITAPTMAIARGSRLPNGVERQR
jgi:hypothetical protein